MSHDKLKEILTRRLKLKDPHFRLEGRGRVSGSVVSATFAGKGDSDRQRMIWDALDAELGAASVNTSMLIDWSFSARRLDISSGSNSTYLPFSYS